MPRHRLPQSRARLRRHPYPARIGPRQPPQLHSGRIPARAARGVNIVRPDVCLTIPCRVSARSGEGPQDGRPPRSDARHRQSRYRNFDFNQLKLVKCSEFQAVCLHPLGRILHKHQRGEFVGTQHGTTLRWEK
ncbi:hypothetical protein PUN4_180136 [Paraburkholderia unamae]|nr:hypothetical protein PUN4_180136 [Paraburkholderia unamae]